MSRVHPGDCQHVRQRFAKQNALARTRFLVSAGFWASSHLEIEREIELLRSRQFNTQFADNALSVAILDHG